MKKGIFARGGWRSRWLPATRRDVETQTTTQKNFRRRAVGSWQREKGDCCLLLVTRPLFVHIYRRPSDFPRYLRHHSQPEEESGTPAVHKDQPQVGNSMPNHHELTTITPPLLDWFVSFFDRCNFKLLSWVPRNSTGPATGPSGVADWSHSTLYQP